MRLEQRSKAVFGRTKIQFWKQFTTGGHSTAIMSGLYSVEQRYNFESNLQQFLFGDD